MLTRWRSLGATSSLLFTLLALAMPTPAEARKEATFAYPFSRVWNAAVRLVRVELECPISEKDKDDGYFFFEYANQGKTYPGTLEVITLHDETDGAEQVRVIVQVPAMPTYIEGMILERLGRKLEKEYGIAKTAPAQPKPAPQPNPGAAPSTEPTADKGGKPRRE